MSEGLYQRVRPKNVSELVGQKRITTQLLQYEKDIKKIPHAILLSGPSGTGKTTVARILARLVNCSMYDLNEINCADFRGIDAVRSIRSGMGLMPMQGKAKVYLIDEFHRATNDAQEAMLKMLEDTPKHVYFFLATTEPNKLKKAILTRCTEMKFELMKNGDIVELLKNVLSKEYKKNKSPSSDVISDIVEASEGSARKALVILEQVMNCDNESEQLQAITAASYKGQSIDLARVLFNPKSSWTDAAKILKDLEDEPEGVRRLILKYAETLLLKGGPMGIRAARVIEVFSFDLFSSGRPGLSLYCYQILTEK